jgi:hypothetical protein
VLGGRPLASAGGAGASSAATPAKMAPPVATRRARVTSEGSTSPTVLRPPPERLGFVANGYAGGSNVAITGAWSEALLPLRISRSIVHSVIRASSDGVEKMWSMRRPWFRKNEMPR